MVECVGLGKWFGWFVASAWMMMMFFFFRLGFRRDENVVNVKVYISLVGCLFVIETTCTAH